MTGGALPRTAAPRWRAAAVISLVLLASCAGGGGFQYVKSPDSKAFFKVPTSWHMFDKRQMLVATGQSLSEETDQRVSWIVGFDGDPKPDIKNVLDLARPLDHPAVRAEVQSLSFDTHERISLRALRNAVYPVDDLLQNDSAELLDYDEITLPGGFRGLKLVYDVLTRGATSATLGNTVIRVNQRVVVDAATENIYVFFVRCESHCYRDNQRVIEQVADSWTVKER